MPIVETCNLTKKFGKITAVDNLNIRIEEGEVFGLLGPNGAGKTTIIKMLATLLEPTSGIAKVNGFDVLEQPQMVRESIGIVFQEWGVAVLKELEWRLEMKMATSLGRSWGMQLA
ncbi:MAG: ATP-binding cassette domain-containing protein [Candidatus Bathyarchaeota archaeon]|nr:ATP-binding cassette domain-containing protein [Candidatus Bathyarchaeota archaeon]